VHSPTRWSLALAATGLTAGAIAFWAFPRAFPTVALENRLTQESALAKADSFFAANLLADSLPRRAVRFSSDDSTITFLDLAAGGADSINAVVRRGETALYRWSVRAFESQQVREARVEFAPDGRLIGFRRRLANSDTLPNVAADSARRLATLALANTLRADTLTWHFISTSYETRRESGRVDHSVTFERAGTRIGGAPVRLEVTVSGDVATGARPFVYVPESFLRRYAEMRTWNDLLAVFAQFGLVALIGLAGWTIYRYSRQGQLRWRGPIVVGSVVAVALVAAGVNAQSLGWFDYDTTLPAEFYQLILAMGAVSGGVATGAMVALTLVAAEAAARHAFPAHVDWWKLWSARGTSTVAGQVAGGYVVAALALAYVTTFYLITQNVLGWWVPTSLVDDPNMIATPAPWITGVAISLQAGIWEEGLFRALPLSLLSLWVGNRQNRTQWMIGGVVATSLVFGFAHSNYPSWPAWSRGVELLIDASFWAVVFLRFGLLPAVIGHFAYNLVLFSLFTATGDAPVYRTAFAVCVTVLFVPALAVVVQVVRQRGLRPLPDDMRFGAAAGVVETMSPAAVSEQASTITMTPRVRQLAVALVAVAVVLPLTTPRRPTLGPAYTATRASAITVADSMLAARGVNPDGWRRLATTARDTLTSWPRFLAKRGLDSLAQPMAAAYVVPAWWVVRYVRPDLSVAERAEEWRVRVYPDGRALDARHILPDSMPGDSLTADAARVAARQALFAAGVDSATLVESDFAETSRPRRRDVTLTWTDTAVHLGEGASARVWVSLAGADVLAVRRGVQLPESFLREEREQVLKSAVMGGVFGTLVMALLVTMMIVAVKRVSPRVTDSTLHGRSGRIAAVLLFAAALAGTANGWADGLFSYDTASSWGNHLITQGTFALLGLLGPVVVILMWRLMESLRRRAGIAVRPSGLDAAASGRWIADAVLAGAAMASVRPVTGAIASWFADPPLPGAPSTSFDQSLPWAASLIGVPLDLTAPIIAVAIPILALCAAVERERNRWLILVGVTIAGAAIVGPTVRAMQVHPLGTVELIVSGVGTVAVAFAVRHWARWGPIAWIAAGAMLSARASLRAIRVADGASEVIAAGLALVGVVALTWWAARAIGRGEATHAAG